MIRGAALALLLLIPPSVGARELCPPTPTAHVTDEGSFIFSKLARRELNRRLDAYHKRTGHEVFVWVGATTEGEDPRLPIHDRLFRFAFRCYNAWDWPDDGVALFVFVADDASWITVGLDAKPRLSNAEAYRIHGRVISPLMRAKRYQQAVEAGVNAIVADLGK